MTKQIVVVGGGVAAKGFLSAGVKLHPEANFTFIRRNEKAPVPCGIPYAFGTLKNPYENVSSDQGLLDAGVTLKIDEVVGVDHETKSVKLASGEHLRYDRLVMATGAEPIVPPFKGRELDNIEVIVKDLDIVAQYREKINESKKIVIVGGGFIGVEMADEISKLGDKEITVVELADHILSAAFDERYCKEAEKLLMDQGIQVITKIGVTAFDGKDKVERVLLSDGQALEADLVFLSIGVRPEVTLAMEMGLSGDWRQGITVDAYQYTSDPEVLAIGDCAAKIDLITGKPSGVKLASVAAREGRIAAANLFKKVLATEPQGISSLFSTAIDGVYFGATGMTQAQLNRENISHEVIEVKTIDRHPISLPDANEMIGSFMFAKRDGRLLGCQIRGASQVAEAINFMGYALQVKASAYDLYALNYASHPMGTASPNKYLVHMAATEMLSRI